MDTPESVRAELSRMRVLMALDVEMFNAEELLERYAELLERSAGEWVPVGERLPPRLLPVRTARKGLGSTWIVTPDNGIDLDGTWKYGVQNDEFWLDAKLPTAGQRGKQR